MSRTIDLVRKLIVPGSEPKERAKKEKVGIVVPSNDYVDANFAMALAAMTYSMGFPLCLFNQKGSNVAINRNSGVGQCQKFELDWCLMIDSDLTFHPMGAMKLIAQAVEMNLDIVGATYLRRTAPYTNLAKPKGNTQQRVQGLVEVDALPTGFLLIRMSVFEKLKRPYFRFTTVEEGSLLPDYLAGMCENDGAPHVIGEDYDFCARARAAGVKIHLDVDLSYTLVHWGERGVQLLDEDQAAADPAHPFQFVEMPA